MTLENLKGRFVQSTLVPGCDVSLHVAYRAHTWDRRHHGRMRNREPKSDLRQRAIHARQVPLESRHVFHYLLLPVAAKIESAKFLGIKLGGFRNCPSQTTFIERHTRQHTHVHLLR